jgi:hypothetical protein
MSKAPAADTAPPHHHPAKGRGRRRKVGAIIKPSASPSELRKAVTHGVWTAGSSQSPVRWVGTPSPASTASGSALGCMVQKLKRSSGCFCGSSLSRERARGQRDTAFNQTLLSLAQRPARQSIPH